MLWCEPASHVSRLRLALCVLRARQSPPSSSVFTNPILSAVFTVTGFYFRKDDIPKLELIHIARLNQNQSRFFYQKKQFNMPQYVAPSLTGSYIHLLAAFQCAFKPSLDCVPLDNRII